MNTLSGMQISRYAAKLYKTWIVDARVKLSCELGKQCDLRANVLVESEDFDLVSRDALIEIRGLLIEMIEKVWCSSHDFSKHIMVGLVLDTGCRPQLMMWVTATPRKSVVREHRH